MVENSFPSGTLFCIHTRFTALELPVFFGSEMGLAVNKPYASSFPVELCLVERPLPARFFFLDGNSIPFVLREMFLQEDIVLPISFTLDRTSVMMLGSEGIVVTGRGGCFFILRYLLNFWGFDYFWLIWMEFHFMRSTSAKRGEEKLVLFGVSILFFLLRGEAFLRVMVGDVLNFSETLLGESFSFEVSALPIVCQVKVVK
jgi:hypothetical protein